MVRGELKKFPAILTSKKFIILKIVKKLLSKQF